MYNKNPYFGLAALWKKRKKETENRGSGYAKLALKNHGFDTLKKRRLDHLFRKIVSLDAPAIHETISSSDGFFWQSATVKSWMHCKITALSSSITQGTLWVRELRSICEELELNWCFLLQILLSHFHSRELQRCHKQACCYISPGHHVSDTELQILVCFSSNFLAIRYCALMITQKWMLCWSVVHLKRRVILSG